MGFALPDGLQPIRKRGSHPETKKNRRDEAEPIEPTRDETSRHDTTRDETSQAEQEPGPTGCETFLMNGS